LSVSPSVALGWIVELKSSQLNETLYTNSLDKYKHFSFLTFDLRGHFFLNLLIYGHLILMKLCTQTPWINISISHFWPLTSEVIFFLKIVDLWSSELNETLYTYSLDEYKHFSFYDLWPLTVPIKHKWETKNSQKKRLAQFCKGMLYESK
jgi:hypothetical protein